jgi:hypothetical protein
MTKSKRLVLMITNAAMLLAGLLGVLGFIGLTHQHSTYGYSGYASVHDITATTDVARLQTMGGVAAWNWERFTGVIDASRWCFLGLGAVLVIGSIVHLCLSSRRSPD